jgi:hypothetical protein
MLEEVSDMKTNEDLIYEMLHCHTSRGSSAQPESLRECRLLSPIVSHFSHNSKPLNCSYVLHFKKNAAISGTIQATTW